MKKFEKRVVTNYGTNITLLSQFCAVTLFTEYRQIRTPLSSSIYCFILVLESHYKYLSCITNNTFFFFNYGYY